MAKTSAFNMLQ